MRKIILSLIIIFVIVTLVIIGKSLMPWDNSIKINDVTQKMAITIFSNKNGIAVIRILITGYIDGKATIKQGNGDNVTYTYELKAGEVYLPIETDWYEKKCIIEYSPVGVKSGNLRIRYKFENLWGFKGWKNSK